MAIEILDTTISEEIVLQSNRDQFIAGQLVEKGQHYKTRDKAFADYQLAKSFSSEVTEEKEPNQSKSKKATS